jgi:hypothetical protein
VQRFTVGNDVLTLHAEEFVEKNQVFDLDDSLKRQGVKGAVIFFTSREKITLQQVKFLADQQTAHPSIVFVVVAQRLPSRSDVMMSMDAARANYHVIYDPKRAIYGDWKVDEGGLVLVVNQTGHTVSRLTVPAGLLVGQSLKDLKGKLEEMIRMVESSG